MELEISAGAGIEADLRTLHADAPQRAVTEHILALADQAGYGAALIDAAAQGHAEVAVITWPQFAHMVRAAARGLSRRGLREGDTAGIFVDDAVSHAVAVHAVRAAGAIAAPVRPAQSAADIAAQLKECRARLLITSAGLADLAIQAAERCLGTAGVRVRRGRGHHAVRLAAADPATRPAPGQRHDQSQRSATATTAATATPADRYRSTMSADRLRRGPPTCRGSGRTGQGRIGRPHS